MGYDSGTYPWLDTSWIRLRRAATGAAASRYSARARHALYSLQARQQSKQS